MDSRVLPLQSWNQMDPIPYKARDIHRDQCRNFSFFKDAPILIRQISIPFQLTNFSDRELKKFKDFIQEVSKMNTKKHSFYSNVNPGQRNGLDKIYLTLFTMHESCKNVMPNDLKWLKFRKPGQSISQAKHFQLDVNDILLLFSCLAIIFLISIINLDLKLVLVMVRGSPDAGPTGRLGQNQGWLFI